MLKGGRRTEAPQRFLFVDTETRPVKRSEKETENPLYLGACYFWQRARPGHPEKTAWYDFDTIHEFWQIVDSLTQEKQGICVMAHNIGFDIQVLGGLKTLETYGWEIKSAIIDSPPFIVKARRGTSSLLLLDFLNYFRGSLASAGEFVGVPKLEMPTRKESKDAWRVYCRNDVLVLATCVRRYVEFLDHYDLGTFAHTLAGQSLNAFRHRFMEHEIFIHTRDEAIAIERDGYYGGRVEMFHRNILPARTYSYLDINSAYPAVMRDGLFPVSFEGIEHNPSIERLETLLSSRLLMARVRVRTEIPLYPLRMESRLVFPIGSFVTTLATPELSIALQRGHIEECEAVSIYAGENIFRPWVEEIYELRKDAKKKGDALWDEMLKRMMNSLFGKFGQRNYEWEIIQEKSPGPDQIWKEYDRTTGILYTLRRIGGVLQLRRAVEEGFNSFVAISAHVTSSARVLLLHYIEQAGWDHVYYVDTDSLIVDGPGYIRLRDSINESALGMLKLESQSKRVRLSAPKNYQFGKMEKHKGRRKDAIKKPDGRYEQDQFVSLVGALRLGWNGGPLIRRITKHDRLTYRKGVVNDDNSISPIRLFTP